MTLLLALTAHAADAPDTEAIRLLVAKTVGKPVPEKYLCVAEPALPEPFPQDERVFVGGIKLKGVGCVRRAILHGGRVQPEEGALNAVLGGTWGKLDDEARSVALTAWSRDVLHAFDQVQETPEISISGKTTTASLPVLTRTKAPLIAQSDTWTWTVDPAGVTSGQTSETQLYKTTLVLETNSAKGIEEGQVASALESVGKIFEKCFWAGWQQDLSMTERTRLTWDIEGGKAVHVAARRQASGKLSQCYANALARAEFPADGSVDLELGVSRIPVDALPEQ